MVGSDFPAGTAIPGKSPEAFRTISEVATELELPQHVLRFWESKFNQIRPLKRGGNRRYYRPEDINLLRRIRNLLYEDGYTIKGVQKLLREDNRRSRLPRPKTLPNKMEKGLVLDSAKANAVEAAIKELDELKSMLSLSKK